MAMNMINVKTTTEPARSQCVPRAHASYLEHGYMRFALRELVAHAVSDVEHRRPRESTKCGAHVKYIVYFWLK